jgi:hypothetical protein
MLVVRALLLLTALFGLTSPLQAQRTARGNAGLRATMTAFLRALPDDRGQDTTRRWFPTAGEWSYTHTIHEPGGGAIVGRWIVPAAQTSLLFGFGKGTGPTPIDDSFEVRYEGGQKEGVLLEVVMSTSDRWRRVGRNRFVPPGARASSPIFVEWRRENGRWVISAFGDEHTCNPRLAGYAVGDVMGVRGLPEPAQPMYAANEPWFINGEVRYFDGHRYMKFGQPRELQPGDLEQTGWHGNIRVYVEKGQTAAPRVLYVPTAADTYQPYVTYNLEDNLCP